MSPTQRYAITRIVPAIVFAGIIIHAIHAAGFAIYLLAGFFPALLALLIKLRCRLGYWRGNEL